MSKFYSKLLLLLGVMTLLWGVVSCTQGPIDEDFSDAGSWGTGDTGEAEGQVDGGVYDFLVRAQDGIYWTTADEQLGDGVYQVSVTQVEGPLDNGFGILFMANMEERDFYLFEVSGDGYVWIAYCENACEDNIEMLVGEGWVESPLVNTGLNATNVLTVQVEAGSMVFFVNDQEVGRAFNDRLTTGDIGLLVETLGAGGVRVHFDDFKYEPLES